MRQVFHESGNLFAELRVFGRDHIMHGHQDAVEYFDYFSEDTLNSNCRRLFHIDHTAFDQLAQQPQRIKLTGARATQELFDITDTGLNHRDHLL